MPSLRSRLPRPPFRFLPPPTLAGVWWKAFLEILPGYKQPDLTVLADLPGNTAKAHGRPHSTWLFFRFVPGTPDRAGELRKFLRRCLDEGWHTSLGRQLKDWGDYRGAKQAAEDAGTTLADDDPVAIRPFGSVMLTQQSFRILDPGLAQYDAFVSDNDAFNYGMKAQRRLLMDFPAGAPAAEDPWIGHKYEEEFDLAIMLARNTRPNCDQLAAAVEAAAGKHQLARVHREDGFVWQPDPAGMREPFGFRDGISNLLFLDEDYQDFLQTGGKAWDPRGTWEQLLYLAPHGANAAVEALEGGSFVVLRKLEQDVEMLREWEGTQPAGAAARLIGRTPGGVPLAGDPANPRLNDFNYAADQPAKKCPFHAHIRKANPRSSSSEKDGERSVLFVRRGMVYAAKEAAAAPTLPAGEVGLLFLGYMGSIDRQFRTMHTNWLDLAAFLHPSDDARDALLAPRPGLGRLVTPRGGGYFFTPPLSWLRTLG